MTNKKIYITVTGVMYRYGIDIFERGMRLELEKNPENEYDKEAIKVSTDGLGQVGWVANSVRTVMGESYSAGRLYDKIGDTAVAEVVYVLRDAVMAVVTEE